MAQDAEGGMGLYATVFIACIKRGEACDKLVLDAAGKSAARAAGVVAEGFRAPPAARVDVDADEYIRRPCVGGIHYAGEARGLAVEVVALQELDGAARRLQVFAAEGAIGQRKVTFPQG